MSTVDGLTEDIETVGSGLTVTEMLTGNWVVPGGFGNEVNVIDPL